MGTGALKITYNIPRAVTSNALNQHFLFEVPNPNLGFGQETAFHMYFVTGKDFTLYKSQYDGERNQWLWTNNRLVSTKYN
jgi:hypothetical protein